MILQAIANILLLCFFLELCAIFVAGKQEGYIQAFCTGFENIYMPYIFGFLGLAFWLRISKVLVPILENNKIANAISKNTFSIMMHHLLGFFLLNCCYLIIAKSTSIIEGFNIQKFYSSIWYLYLPKNLPQFRILYVIFGVSFSILLAFSLEKIKAFLKHIIQNHFSHKLAK